MKRSQITIELIKDEINVVQAMDILNLLLQDIKDKKIKNGWKMKLWTKKNILVLLIKKKKIEMI